MRLFIRELSNDDFNANFDKLGRVINLDIDDIDDLYLPQSMEIENLLEVILALEEKALLSNQALQYIKKLFSSRTYQPSNVLAFYECIRRLYLYNKLDNNHFNLLTNSASARTAVDIFRYFYNPRSHRSTEYSQVSRAFNQFGSVLNYDLVFFGLQNNCNTIEEALTHTDETLRQTIQDCSFVDEPLKANLLSLDHENIPVDSILRFFNNQNQDDERKRAWLTKLITHPHLMKLYRLLQQLSYFTDDIFSIADYFLEYCEERSQNTIDEQCDLFYGYVCETFPDIEHRFFSLAYLKLQIRYNDHDTISNRLHAIYRAMIDNNTVNNAYFEFLLQNPNHIPSDNLQYLHLQAAAWQQLMDAPKPDSESPSSILESINFPDVHLPYELRCSITHGIVNHPVVITGNPHIYERHTLLTWLFNHPTNPMTREPLDTLAVHDAPQVKEAAEAFTEQMLACFNQLGPKYFNTFLDKFGVEVTVTLFYCGRINAKLELRAAKLSSAFFNRLDRQFHESQSEQLAPLPTVAACA